MIDGSIKNDIDRLGLSDESRQVFDELLADGYFKDGLSCYRLAVSVAIKNNIQVSSHSVKRPQGHMYLISQFDPEGIFAAVIIDLFPEFKEEKYRFLEKFADLGMIFLQKEIDKNNSLIF